MNQDTLTAEEIQKITEAHSEEAAPSRIRYASLHWRALCSLSAYLRYAESMGSFYFSENTLRWFKTRLNDGIRRDENYIYTRISDYAPHIGRVYSIVRMDICGNVEKLPEAEDVTRYVREKVWNSLPYTR